LIGEFVITQPEVPEDTFCPVKNNFGIMATCPITFPPTNIITRKHATFQRCVVCKNLLFETKGSLFIIA
jgi:hypothetical protein